MPPMIAPPTALPKDKEYEFAQEFELDIRVSPVTALSTLDPAATGGQCGPTHASCPTPCPSCHSCNCTDTCTMGCNPTFNCTITC